MLQNRARGEAEEEGARSGARPAREVGGGGRGRGAEEETEDEDENAIKKGRNRGKSAAAAAVGKEPQDALPAAAKVKWAVIGRRRRWECDFIIR